LSASIAPLEEEIGRARREISSDSYPMSIGELTNLYREGELIINPAFQRFFRWDSEQKSRLIESILLGIPLPSIFVSQRDDGKWELVDGLQRVSTILQLQGLLAQDGEPLPPLMLTGTKYLPSLEGKAWERETIDQSLTQAQRLDVKRSKIDVKIIKRESSSATKYDLFQRLNSYGSPLTSQEMRSALLISVNGEFYDWLERLATWPPFVDCVALTDRLVQEKYDIELVLRFLFLHNRSPITNSLLRNFGQVLDDASVEMAERFPHNSAEQEEVFKATFQVLWENGGDDVFRKWDPPRNSFVGGFLNTAYEVIAMGLGFHIAHGSPFRRDTIAAAQELWKREDMTTRFATGLSTEARLTRMLPLGRELMGKRP
jgi:Protein of unknown function DUF262